MKEKLNEVLPFLVLIFFFTIGMLCITIPYKIQNIAIRYYNKPDWVTKIPIYRNIVKKSEFVKNKSYIVFLRVIGIISLLISIGGFYLFITTIK